MARPRYLVAVAALAILLASVPAGAFTVQEGIAFIAIQGSTEGTEFVLADKKGNELGRGNADSFGSLIFRRLPQGARLLLTETGGAGAPTEVQVLRFKDHPKQDFYAAQTLVEGFQYIEARDGTLLSAMVRAPIGLTLADGPFPTVVEYSGYDPANPDSPQPSTQIAQALGFATVGVNMRGSGCSGGVIDLFDLPTTADGYDIIETVAAQSWVKGGKVGMVGISFPGISQIFVGGARPPHLKALAPLSVIADIYRAPGLPGGIFNNGFAQSWLLDRAQDAEPAPDGGQAWAIKRVNEGDAVCLANQTLRYQTEDPIAVLDANPHYDPSIMDDRSPVNWISKIRVPMFLAGAWQDEQTGGDFASMLNKIPKRKNVKVTLTNGVHTSALDPETAVRWIEFLQIYVAEQDPDYSLLPILRNIVYGQILGPEAPPVELPEFRFEGVPYAEARKRFEADPPVRVLLENGAGTADPGMPGHTHELGFKRFPPKEAKLTAFYFGADGKLTTARPVGAEEGVDSYAPDPEARPMQTLPGSGEDDSWAVLPPYDWQPFPPANAVGYVTDALTAPVTIVGPGSVDLWLESSAADTDIQVTLSEVRPDDKEFYVQSGWLRASHRLLDKKNSTKLDPRPTHLVEDEAPLPAGEFSLVRVKLFPSAHVFRAGSKIRLTVEAPGGDRTRWSFDTPLTGGLVTNEIAHTAAQPSKIVLPVVPNPTPPAELPACPSLRGQPCRDYVPAGNGG
jgi:predicted acyl esterase